tara:strand:- start:68 stop:643 length:576 start_codon:yes stop_codon:yes gene_type:complete
MRYGKPIKNKKRIDPRYFLNELEVGADVDTVDIEKLLDLTSDKPIFTAQSSEADITGVIEPHETESAALRAAKAVQDEKELPWDWDPDAGSEKSITHAIKRMKANTPIFTGHKPAPESEPGPDPEPELKPVAKSKPEVEPELESEKDILKRIKSNARMAFAKAAPGIPGWTTGVNTLAEIIDNVFERMEIR